MATNALTPPPESWEPAAEGVAGTPGARQAIESVAAQLSTPVLIVGESLQVAFANAACAAALGARGEQLAGSALGEVLEADAYAVHEAALRRALAGEAAEYRHAQRDGDRIARLWHVNARPLRDAAGAVEGAFCEMLDVTETETSEARFRMLLEGVPNQLLFLDRGLRIEFASGLFLQASGWSAETARGRHISEILGEERFRERLPDYERALAGESVSYESTGAAGREAGYFRFSYRPSFDSQGRVCGIFSLAVDLTETREMQLELEAKQTELVRSNRDLEQFAYVASHDLKAPLRAIELLVGWITEELEGYDAGDVQENLGLLSQRTQRLGRLLDDLLAYSRAGRRVGELRETDCHELVQEAIQLIDPPDNFVVEVAGRLPRLTTYAGPLEQVLRNLINNAIKHHPGPSGTVTVSCEEREEAYVFSVRDDGAGIPAEYADRVFEMFQTLKPRDDIEGSGMGLAIVNRIVAWQGGRVWFETPADGIGTAFRFAWNKRAPSAARAPEVT